MDNLEISKIFYEIANLLEAQDVPFKPQAYRNTARLIATMTEDIGFLYHTAEKKALEALPGIGEHIAQKIVELIETGNLKYLEQLRKEVPVRMTELTRIEGIGPKTVKKLYDAYGVQTIDDLERVIKEGKIHLLPGFKEKSEHKFLQGIEFLRSRPGRLSYAEAEKIAIPVFQKILSHPNCQQASLAGSLRRKKTTIGDIDILAISDQPQKLIDDFCAFPEVMYVHGKGGTKASVKLQNSFDVDLRVVPASCWGSALQYFTGDKNHNIALRTMAQKLGYKLNEYGLFQGEKRIAGETEESIYFALGLKWIPPEERLNEREFEKYRL